MLIDMRRKLAAALTVLALAACFGRVSAWASTGDPHACCASDSSKAPSLVECCPTPAAVAAPHSPAPDLLLIDVPVFVPSAAVPLAPEDDSAAPPGPQTFRSAVPARAPPLA